MNILKITKEFQPRKGDVITVSLLDIRNNVIKSMDFEDVCQFDVSNNIDVDAARLRIENERLKKENELLKENRKAYRSYITCLEREIKELQEEIY